MDSYKLSKAWHIGHKLAVTVHELARGIPHSDHYKLNIQLRRASASVPLLLEESLAATSHPDKHRCYNLAREAAAELHEHLLLARERQYIDQASFKQVAGQSIDVYHLLTSVIRAHQIANTTN